MKRLLFIWIAMIAVSCADSGRDFSWEETLLITSNEQDTPMRVWSVENPEELRVLRQDAVDITVIKDNSILEHLVNRLLVTMDYEGGVGIAAPQVGISKNVFLFTRVSEENQPVQVVINPIIRSYSPDMFVFENDGCLSIPNISGSTVRHEWIDVEYYDLSGQKISERLYAAQRPVFDAVIFQHEYDHLRGRLFTDVIIEKNEKIDTQ